MSFINYIYTSNGFRISANRNSLHLRRIFLSVSSLKKRDLFIGQYFRASIDYIEQRLSSFYVFCLWVTKINHFLRCWQYWKKNFCCCATWEKLQKVLHWLISPNALQKHLIIISTSWRILFCTWFGFLLERYVQSWHGLFSQDFFSKTGKGKSRTK